MAIIKSFVDANIEENVSAPIIVDINIIEYFYAATIEEVLADDNLVKLIASNGFYKTAFCEAYGLKEISVIVVTKTYIFKGPPKGVPSVYDTFVGKKIGVMGADIINLEVENINKVNG